MTVKHLTRRFFILFFGIVLAVQTFAQQPPFYKDIQRFKQQDSIRFPEQQAIVFVGSSSFTMWKDVQDYFPAHKIINRGFGGSTLPDVIRYVDAIVTPYHPKQIVIYCGENDVASSDTLTAETVAKRFVQLFRLLRKKNKKANIVYVSMKPSPSREKFLPTVIAANAAIEQFLATQKNTAFVNIYPLMLDAEGKPRKELFLKDMLHMNKTGYEIWQKELRKVLK